MRPNPLAIRWPLATRWPLPPAALFLGACLLGGCRGELDTGDSTLALQVVISPTPPAVGPARLIISLTDSVGDPVDGAEIVVEGNMSHAGMVPVVDTAMAEGSGMYSVPAFQFTMAGDWVLGVQATLPDGRLVRTEKGTNVVGAMGRGL